MNKCLKKTQSGEKNQSPPNKNKTTFFFEVNKSLFGMFVFEIQQAPLSCKSEFSSIQRHAFCIEKQWVIISSEPAMAGFRPRENTGKTSMYTLRDSRTLSPPSTKEAEKGMFYITVFASVAQTLKQVQPQTTSWTWLIGTVSFLPSQTSTFDSSRFSPSESSPL